MIGMRKLEHILAVGLVLLSGVTVVAQSEQPNIVFMMADDLGPGWVDYDGSSDQINTPNLERMARSGMVFSRAYAAASVCSPTRAACITGMSPAQLSLTTHIPGVAGRRHPALPGGPKDAPSINQLPLELPSYARELKNLGYATAFFGKWHLAGEGSVRSEDGVVDAKYHPEHFGFDSNLGGCAYGHPKSWFDPYKNGTIENRKPGEYLTDRLGDEAVAFIKAKKDQPFHLSLWFYSVHTPIRAPKDLVKRNGGNAYLAMVESMDAAIGKVLDALEGAGVRDNTLVVFYSDNGGDKPTEGLAEKKGSLLEGGLRVPMVVSWPGVITGGSQSEEPVTSMDFFPTFVHAAGGSTKQIEELEGLDLLPLFNGAEKLVRDALFWHYPHNRKGIKYDMGSVILSRDWKYYLSHGVNSDALFNLKDDPMEATNVLAENPERSEEMREQLNQWLTKVNAKMPPTGSKAQVEPLGKVAIAYSEANGIGAEAGVMRRDPSDVIKVGELYYVWYSKGAIPSGYDATVWYATSPDGHDWTEQGMALAKGAPGSWEASSVFTPNILVAEGKYWLFYTGTSRPYKKPFNPDSKIGIAVSDSPDGPWERLDTNPALKNSDNPNDFDSHLIDDACLIVRDGKYWFYYKGRQLGKKPSQTQLGLAIAEKPEGPYIKHEANPIIPGNHEVLVWPQGDGVAALIGVVGPKEWVESLIYSEDGLHFTKTHDVEHVPHAAGAYRPEAFTESGTGEQIKWGVHIGKQKGSLPFIERFDLEAIE